MGEPDPVGVWPEYHLGRPGPVPKRVIGPAQLAFLTLAPATGKGESQIDMRKDEIQKEGGSWLKGRVVPIRNPSPHDNSFSSYKSSNNKDAVDPQCNVNSILSLLSVLGC